MVEQISESGPDKHNRINNQTLLFVRWMAVIGQSLAVIVTHFLVGIKLALIPIIGCIFFSVLVNLFAQLRYGSRSLQPFQACAFMGYDIIQLSALLWLTGGLENPFAVMIVAPASVAATLLPLKYTVALIGLALISIAFISFHAVPLNWPDTTTQLPFPDLYLLGVGLAISLSLIFICLYIWRISSESRAISRAHQISQLALARQQEISSLGALSAAAAHELGSPLSTLSVISKDMNSLLNKNNKTYLHEIESDIRIFRDEVQKCHSILKNLGTKSPNKSIRDLDTLTFDVLISALAEPYDKSYPEIKLYIRYAEDSSNEKVYIKKTPELDFGLGNILQNAFKFAKSEVDVTITIQKHHIAVTIQDDGPGFSNSVLRNIGEPYVSEALISSKPDNVIARETGLGLGLGVFIAQNLLSRYNVDINFKNRTDQKGAIVTLTFERPLIEIQNQQISV